MLHPDALAPSTMGSPATQQSAAQIDIVATEYAEHLASVVDAELRRPRRNAVSLSPSPFPCLSEPYWLCRQFDCGDVVQNEYQGS